MGGLRARVQLVMDPGVLARIDGRRTGSRSLWVERACRAFLAHDEGCARELARVVERFRAASGPADGVWVADPGLDADAAGVLAAFAERCRS